MGVHNFSKVFTPKYKVNIKKKDELKKILQKENMISDKITLAKDGYAELIRHTYNLHKSGLVNSKGKPTSHIKSVFNNIVMELKMGIRTIWCFDNRDPKPYKQKTLDTRAKARDKQKELLKKAHADLDKLKDSMKGMKIEDILSVDPDYEKTFLKKENEVKKLSSRAPTKSQFKMFLDDVMFILNCFNIPYKFAPSGTEAEELAVYLCKKGICQGIITTDADAILLGAPFILRKIPRQSNMYNMFILKDCLNQHELTQAELIKIGVALGIDDEDKVPRVGPKTVIKKIRETDEKKKIKWSPRHLEIIAGFREEKKQLIGSERDIIFKPPEGIEKLRDWLVIELEFNKERIDKSLDNIQLNISG